MDSHQKEHDRSYSESDGVTYKRVRRKRPLHRRVIHSIERTWKKRTTSQKRFLRNLFIAVVVSVAAFMATLLMMQYMA